VEEFGVIMDDKMIRNYGSNFLLDALNMTVEWLALFG
jgi:hypothetical protein